MTIPAPGVGIPACSNALGVDLLDALHGMNMEQKDCQIELPEVTTVHLI